MSNKRWQVRPEVAGALGENAIIDSSTHPPKVSRLHCHFDGWLGDDLLEVFPCFLVSERLARAIQQSNLTGWRLAPVEATESVEFEELYPNRGLPKFCWLQVIGDSAADFSLSAESHLVVSEEALRMLQCFIIENALVESANAP
jgi:hypothetical protein